MLSGENGKAIVFDCCVAVSVIHCDHPSSALPFFILLCPDTNTHLLIGACIEGTQRERG
jgi:hypothetical protein